MPVERSMFGEMGGSSCPSAQPEMDGARVFAVLAGTPANPRIAYFKKGVVVEPSVVKRLGSIPSTQVFRFAARCEEKRCVHYEGARCTLAQRIVNTLDAVVDTLPS